MIYKFKSKVTGDVIMLGPVGDRVLALLGRDPAPQGIFLPEVMPELMACLTQAVHADDAARAQSALSNSASADLDELVSPVAAVSLRQRVWPLVEMLRRCHAEGEPVVWGV